MRALVVLFLAGTAHADVELWTEAGVRHEVNRFELAFDQMLRFDENASRVSSVMPELGLRVRLATWFGLGTSYRYEYERNGDGMLVTRHRFDGFATFRLDVARVRLELEERFQEELRPTSHDTERQRLRQQLELSYRKKHWVPAASITVFDRADKLWLTGGVTYRRHHRAYEVFYRYATNDAHIIGASFHTEL